MSVIYDYYYESSVGTFLIATYNGDVCSIQLERDTGINFADMENEMHRLLCKSIPYDISITKGNVDPLVAIPITDIVAGRIKNPPFPTNCFLKATDFQRDVWKAIWNIPYGQTSTYSKIAQKVGSPKAIRAVANACAANPMAILIPCHRVLPKNGSVEESVGEYKWGKNMKLRLLQREKEST
jgi:AraC family transcriptional regulator, regulatory protein of adaptative response / methylated-DNA-[protein]-cysteine methyltransferase